MPARDALFVLDAPETFDIAADTTYVMITEAWRRGWRVFGAEIGDLFLDADSGVARAFEIKGKVGQALTRGQQSTRVLDTFDAIVMRKDPPVDASFVAATWILDRTSTPVFNRPSALRDHNEKLNILRFPNFAPRTFVTRDVTTLREALDELQGRMIVKPLYGYGGREVLLASADDPNLGSILEIATHEGQRFTVAQEFLPDAAIGDKRILMVAGEAIGAVLRVPASGELRDNFHAGGTAEFSPLTEREEEICAAVSPWLQAEGLFFVGLDVIGGQLTEVNVTSPTGMQEINRLGSLEGDATMQARFWDGLERELGYSADA